MGKKPVAIITGASRGIGEHTARKFAQHGYAITLVARNKKLLDALAAELDQSGTETLVVNGDLSDLDFCQTIISRTIEKWGRIDVLVNNAAWRTVETMRTITPETWEKTITICLTAPAFLAKWAAQHMEKQNKGVIINISSIMSQNAGGYSPAYISCKGALESLTYELAALYGPGGIRVVCVNPGAIDTALSSDYIDKEGQDVSQALRKHVNDMTPQGREGKPDEVANAIYWLSSEEASYIHGTIITVDGGRSHNFTSYPIKKLLMPREF